MKVLGLKLTTKEKEYFMYGYHMELKTIGLTGKVSPIQSISLQEELKMYDNLIEEMAIQGVPEMYGLRLEFCYTMIKFIKQLTKARY